MLYLFLLSSIIKSMENSVLQISTINVIIGAIVFLIGIGVAWGTLKKSVSNISDTLKEIKPDLKDVRERFMAVEDKVDTLWKDRFASAHSPRQLNELGRSILEESGIKKIIEDKKDQLLKIIKDQNINNAYDAEEAILSVVKELPKYYPDIVDALKNGAFKTGTDIEGALFVGAIYLRNLIFEGLGFSLGDLDKPRDS